MKRLSKILFCIGTCFTLAALAYVLSGELDGLSNVGEANSEVALLAITFYWILGSFVCWALAVLPEKWKQLALLAFSTVLCAVFLETGLAWLNPSLALREFEFLRSSRQHHVLLPEAAYDLGRFEGKHISVQTNSDRLRTEYSKQSFLNYENRVVCLGDSFTFGAWVDGEESYPAQLENKLRQLGHENVAVLNAGMLSYSPVLHRELLFNTLMQYEPTVVTLMLDCTDIGDDYHYLKDYDRFRENGPFAGQILSRPTPHFGALWRLAKPVHPILLAPIELLQRLNSNHVPHDPLDYYHFEIPVDGAIETDRFFIFRHRPPCRRGPSTSASFRPTWGPTRRPPREKTAAPSTPTIVHSPRLWRIPDEVPVPPAGAAGTKASPSAGIMAKYLLKPTPARTR